MAISGSIDFTLTRDTCIQEALEQLGVLGEGESPTASQLSSDAQTLNLMLKSWQNKEIAQSLIRKFYVFLDDEKRQYNLSTTASSSAHSAHNFYVDTLATDMAEDATSLTVTTGTGAADGDTLLVVLDDGSLGAGDVESGGGTTALVTPAIEGDDAESGSTYFAYTTKVTRPLDILYVNRCQVPSTVGEDTIAAYTSTPCDILSRRDYQALSNKSNEGTPTAVWYDPQWPTATLHVYPEPKGNGEFLECYGQFTIDDMDSASDNFALPSRWYLAVAFNLAFWLTSKYGVSSETRNDIKEKALNSLMDAEFAEAEDYLKFAPNPEGR